MEILVDIATFYYMAPVLFILGACIGSFFNVIIYRFPLGKSIVFPDSACPHCKTKIAPYDNIPILSWFILMGKCRHCKAPISPLYMVNETIYGTIAMIPSFIYPQWWIGLPLSGALLALGPTLYLLVRHKRAPWYLILASVGLGALYAVQLLG